MARTPKPLTIVALPPTDMWQALADLETKGHTVIRARDPIDGIHPDDSIKFETLIAADIILGANAWRMSDDHEKYLTLAIKEARTLKYGKGTYANKKLRDSVGAVIADGVQRTDNETETA